MAIDKYIPFERGLLIVIATGIIAIAFLKGQDDELDRQAALRTHSEYCAMAGANETYCNDKH